MDFATPPLPQMGRAGPVNSGGTGSDDEVAPRQAAQMPIAGDDAIAERVGVVRNADVTGLPWRDARRKQQAD